MHRKRWTYENLILIKTIYAGSALKIRQNYASLDKFSLEMTKLSIKEFQKLLLSKKLFFLQTSLLSWIPTSKLDLRYFFKMTPKNFEFYLSWNRT
jgi:hypothetical protein